MSGHYGYGATRGSGRPPRGKPAASSYCGLTAEMKTVMAAIKDGGDVWGYGEARCLREIERRFPGLVTITKAMQAPSDGAKQQPYFGAILTNAGRKAIEAA
jgi:hypothetical protein